MRISFSCSFVKDKNIYEIANLISNELKIYIATQESNGFWLQPDITYKNSYCLHSKIGNEDKIYDYLINFLNWISNNAAIGNLSQLKIHYHGFYSNLNSTILRLNIREKKIYSLFPCLNSRCKSIKNLKTIDFDYAQNVGIQQYLGGITSLHSDRYGIDFTQIPYKITFQYIHGDFISDITKVIQVLDLYKIAIEKSLEEDLTQSDIKMLRNVFNKKEKIDSSFNSYEKFKKYFPNVKLLVDLTNDNKYVVNFYPVIRSKVMNIISCIFSNDEYYINYDSDNGKYQIKDLKGRIETNSIIKDLDIVKSELTDSDFTGMNFYDCKITKSYFNDCNMIDCDIENTEISSSMLDSNCKLTNCLITNRSLVNGESIECIIRNSYLGPKFKNVQNEIINSKKIQSGHIVIQGKRIVPSKNKW